MSMIAKSLFASVLIGLCLVGSAPAQAPVTGAPVQGVAQYRGTTNGSVSIATGSTFQSVLASLIGTSTVRQSLTIQNNNINTDNCWVFIGPNAGATKGTSILLAPGASYTRYFPYVPNDNISATCATTADTVYVDTQ